MQLDLCAFVRPLSEVRVERCHPVVTAMHYDAVRQQLWCCSEVRA